MSDRSNPFRLFDILRRRADDSVLSEPADLGTAFGLELSMLPDDEVGPSSGHSTSTSPWWRRLPGWPRH